MRIVNPICYALVFLFSLNVYAVDIFQLADCSSPDEDRIIGMLSRGEGGVNDRRGGTGDTLLHIAAKWNHARLASFLIQAGASLTARNNEGLTPYDVHVAYPVQNVELIALLRTTEPMQEVGPEPLFAMPRAPLLLNEVVVIPPAKECVLCLQDLPVENFRRLGCGHENACSECLQDRLVVALDTDWRDAHRHLRCTHADCEYEMNEGDVRAITRDELRVARYNHVLFQLFIDSDPNMRRCPTPGCDVAYMINQGRRPQQIRCDSCFQRYCSHCRGDHIEDAPCRRPNDLVENNNNAPTTTHTSVDLTDNPETLSWILANTKPCPQCGKSIEKNGGCLHMTCPASATGCGYEFCWACQRQWGRETHPNYFECNLPPTSSWRLWQMFTRFGQTPYMRYLRDHRWLQYTLAGVSLVVSVGTWYNRYRRK